MAKLIAIALLFAVSACADKVLYEFRDGSTIEESVDCYAGRVCVPVKKLCHDDFCVTKTDAEIFQMIKNDQ